MNIEEIMTIELEGLSNTINDYSREHYILSYTKKLNMLKYPNDTELIIKLVNRLLSWYEIKMPLIMESKFVVNKEEHKKSIYLLQQLLLLLTEDQ